MNSTFPNKTKWLNRKRILLFVLFASILLLGAMVYWFSNQNSILEQDYNSQNKAVKEEQKFEDFVLHMLKASSAIRSYAATKNDKFGVGYIALVDSVHANYNDLKQIQDRWNSFLDPKLFEEFDRLVKEKIQYMNALKKLCDENNFDSASALLVTEKGNKLADSVLAMKDKTIVSFRQSQNKSQFIFTSLNKRNNNLAYLGIMSAMIFIVIVFYFLFREIKMANNISNNLNLQKDFMKVVLTNLGEGLITTGKDGSIMYMNPVAEKLTGWSNEEGTNKPLHVVYNILNEETGLPFENIVGRIIKEGKTEALENNTILRSKNGENFVISNNGSPLLDSNGCVLGAVLVFNDITEKKKTENELKDSEQLFRNMIDNISEAVYTCDERGYIQVYNKAAVKLWGREPLIGTDRWIGSWKIMNTEGIELKPENSPMATAVKEKRPVLGKEVLIQRHDGSIRHVLPSPAPLFNASGKLTGAVNMLFDITDKKEREVLIKTTEAKYRDLFEQASDAIVTYSFDGKIYEFNDIICSMSGYTKEEFQKLTLSDILVGEVIISKTKYDDILSGKTVTLFRQCKHKSGTLVDMEFKTRLIHGNQVLAIGRDITERKRNEEIIKKANERYEILAKATSDTIWDWDILHDKMLYNYGNRNMFGHEHTEIENVSEWWKKNIHPADLDHVIEYVREVYNKKQHLVQLEYRFRCADGTYKYILDRGFVIYDKKGMAIRMIGAMQDITKEKEHEKQIAVAIFETQEKERRELGMELHDNVNQLLTATLLYLGMATKSSRAGNEVSETLNECAGYINEAINDIRNLSHRLTPYTNDEVSLKEILKWLTDSIQKTALCEIRLLVDEFPDTLVSNDIKTNIYRITQEQLTNILKHAGAGKVEIKVQLNGENIVLIITDNGIGFDPATVTKGIGLQNIKRRAELFSGICTIISSPGNGCEVKVEIPIGKD